MGTQKITMGRGKDTDYESKKSAATSSSLGQMILSLVSNLCTPMVLVKPAKHHAVRIYGNTNLMTGDLLDGNQGIFKPKDDPAGGQANW